MGTMLVVTRPVLASLRAEAAKAAPLECCGILLGRDGRITRIRPAANVHPDPARHFEIDPAVLIAAHREARAGGPELVGYYHSHPAGHPRPSATDCEHASGDGRAWAIVAGGEVTFWRDGEDGFEALSMQAIDG
jgi:proteasome lid subunit RPN8/RPN11